ncbi:hypothetical protein M3Y97_00720000 [Aphelenchoides bicaudatus]|nr:hypothetical protein M3Y97_00720000 [Aphelenchoides bicaudatus]
MWAQNSGKDQPKSSFNYATSIFRSLKRGQNLDAPKSKEDTLDEPSQEPIQAVTYEVDDLREQAIQKLKQEAVRNAERAKTMGVSGWARPRLTVNKQFLGRMVQSTKPRNSPSDKSRKSPDDGEPKRSSDRKRKGSSDKKAKKHKKDKKEKKEKKHKKRRKSSP